MKRRKIKAIVIVAAAVIFVVVIILIAQISFFVCANCRHCTQFWNSLAFAGLFQLKSEAYPLCVSHAGHWFFSFGWIIQKRGDINWLRINTKRAMAN